ncbi:MAG: histidine kinase [Bacteroidetes bacterium]|nr:histidine kinase [Bacteroidota bacterium]
MNKKGFYWICQIGGWLFFVLLQSLFFKLSNAFNTNVATSQFILFTFGIIISHVYRNLIIQLGWLKLNTLKVIPLVIFASIVFATMHDYGQHGVELLLKIAENKYQNNVAIVTSILNLSFIYFFWSLIYFLFHYIENYKKAEIANLKWEASINEIELNKLKSQLNPHFMFNAMNSIRALVDENPTKSKDAITQLSNILRTTLQMGKNKVIDFNEELKVVSDYLALESIRYEERLKTSIQLHPQSKNFQVPPLMIQTLVENGIKHGISKLTQGGILELITEVRENILIIQIKNSGQLKEITESDTGFGIKNTLQRLQLLYGNAASLKISNQDPNTVLTELIIPKNVITYESNNN